VILSAELSVQRFHFRQKFNRDTLGVGSVWQKLSVQTSPWRIVKETMPSPAPLTDDDIDAVCEALLAFYASPMACWRLSGDRFGAHKRHTLTALSQMQAATARLNPAYQAADQPAVR
tara:strand:- start:68 stop:418 length:351 start_codon:yes stop_codon:yes gene_type:complete